MTEEWTVSELADIAKVTVRTLHYYDEIGLLSPSSRSAGDYRLYSRAELERLQEILLYREIRVPLEEIRRLLDDPGTGRASALRAHRTQLTEKRRRLDRVIRTVERTLASIRGGTPMSGEEMFDGFQDLVNAPDDVRESHRAHAKEAHERWGETDAYAESTRRVQSYSKEDWSELKTEAEATQEHMAWLLEAGTAPTSEEAMDGAETMRRHISRWYYDCTHEVHAGLADMYEADPRFRANYEDRAEGLAAFVAAAIRANAERADRG